MSGLLLRADDLLRGGAWATRSQRAGQALSQLFAFVAIFGIAYGAVMGCYTGVHADRLLQVLYSAVKVPLLLLVTFLVSLPSFFVLNTLAGVRDDFVEALRALVATQAGLTIILAAMAPFTALWYFSFTDYTSAILFNAVMFGVASLAAQWLLRRFYRALVERHPAHRWLLRAWLIVYAFVGIQMGWLLRPFIGDPHAPTQFFRHDAWGNAYEQVAHMIWHVIAGA